jgi:crotonobetainyl-CoA:carnitine CoA-transferase CaiB-like acyl-CoA transferase
MAMQGPLFRLSRDEATIAFSGRAHGADTDEVLAGLGFAADDIARMRAEGSIA